MTSIYKKITTQECDGMELQSNEEFHDNYGIDSGDSDYIVEDDNYNKSTLSNNNHNIPTPEQIILKFQDISTFLHLYDVYQFRLKWCLHLFLLLITIHLFIPNFISSLLIFQISIFCIYLFILTFILYKRWRLYRLREKIQFHSSK